ncbi:unnamed protein product, partial [Candidula unifasciata]
MAALVRLLEDAQGLQNLRKSVGEYQAYAARLYEYAAAVRIQAWFRGIRVRAYLKFLNKCATKIQKIWRGFLARRYYSILLRNTVFIMRFKHYNAMASKIQRIWRGYYVRKYVFCYHGRKRYLEALQVKNEIVRKHHYLLSTEVIPGIYNSPFLPCPTEEEYLLRSVQPLSHKKKKADEPEFDPICKNYSSSVLPPLKKPLSSMFIGPFRDPKDVQKQRYKPFQPTLRVCTDFFSLEKAREKLKKDEWVQRINDNL